ncbi:MAG: hypothetical protein EOP66_18030 [Sphingomonas sp.]|nr:MAG: hypothetical protein EOP66_18030 [Sphingomonas sp.]
MQTERVTFLTTPADKAALDAFAASQGRSVGHVLREASMRYMSAASTTDSGSEDDEALDLVLPMLEEALTQMNDRIDRMHRSIDAACDAIDRALAGDHAGLPLVRQAAA